MTITRRNFITASIAAAAGGSAALAAFGQPANAPTQGAAVKPEPKPTVPKADKPLKVLFLGGTIFLGPHTVERLLARGHTVTLFNRGKSNPDLFPELEKLRGDRKNDLASLEAEVGKGRRWDVVIDTCAYVPKYMRASTELLKGAVDHYVMVASVNAYKSDAAPDQDENAPTWEEWPYEAEVTAENYGPMKRGCEIELGRLMPDRWASARPSLIVGPRDVSDRFSYWPLRCKRGGEILAPIGPDEPMFFIDVRDLAGLLVLMAEKRANGPVNALGAGGLKFGPVLSDCIAAAKDAGGPACTVAWAPLTFLNANKVQAWSDLPAWVPSAEPDYAGACRRIGKKSVDLGATFRPVRQTAADILTWWETLPEKRRAKVRSGLTAERETQLLTLLKTAKG